MPGLKFGVITKVRHTGAFRPCPAWPRPGAPAEWCEDLLKKGGVEMCRKCQYNKGGWDGQKSCGKSG